MYEKTHAVVYAYVYMCVMYMYVYVGSARCWLGCLSVAGDAVRDLDPDLVTRLRGEWRDSQPSFAGSFCCCCSPIGQPGKFQLFCNIYARFIFLFRIYLIFPFVLFHFSRGFVRAHVCSSAGCRFFAYLTIFVYLYRSLEIAFFSIMFFRRAIFIIIDMDGTG